MPIPTIRNHNGRFEYDRKAGHWCCIEPSAQGRNRYFRNCYVPSSQDQVFTKAALEAGFTTENFEDPARIAKRQSSVDKGRKILSGGGRGGGGVVKKKASGLPAGFVALDL